MKNVRDLPNSLLFLIASTLGKQLHSHQFAHLHIILQIKPIVKGIDTPNILLIQSIIYNYQKDFVFMFYHNAENRSNPQFVTDVISADVSACEYNPIQPIFAPMNGTIPKSVKKPKILMFPFGRIRLLIIHTDHLL